jgi:uracil-DNA glycosylase family protein
VTIEVSISPTFEAFRDKARALLAANVPPEKVTWNDGGAKQMSLLSLVADPIPKAKGEPPKVPPEFLAAAELAAKHTHKERWNILYRVVWRLTHGEAMLLDNPSDPDVSKFRSFGAEVRADQLRACGTEVSPMSTRGSLNRASMAFAFVPAQANDVKTIANAVEGCRACHIYANATQPVFGEGAGDARIMLVGEQPGDIEDRQGRPFVGPSGKVLHEALMAAAIPREKLWVTNAVKHFKWEPRGERRLHSRPKSVEVFACRAWLEREIAVVKPEVIVCLGSTATHSLVGRNQRFTDLRGKVLEGAPWSTHLVVTHHPSAILRIESAVEGDDEDLALAKENAMQELVADLEKAAQLAS